jgi:hypothetical protein
MTYNPNIHNRKSIRLKDYDYSQEDLYFITICSHNKECIFGEIIEKTVGAHCMCPKYKIKKWMTINNILYILFRKVFYGRQNL